MFAMETIKKKLVTALLLVLSFCSFCQQKQSKIGITAGIAYNTQSKTPSDFLHPSFSYYNRFSPYIGLIYRDSISRSLSIKTSIYYVQRGVRYDYIFDTPMYYLRQNQIITCHYISFPINLAYNYKNFYIGVGVEGSILIKGRSKATIQERSAYSSTNAGFDNWDREKLYQIADAGYGGCLGYKLKNLEIDFSVFHGLIPPAKFTVFAINNFEYKYLYQQTFRLGVNYFLRFKTMKYKK